MQRHGMPPQDSFTKLPKIESLAQIFLGKTSPCFLGMRGPVFKGDYMILTTVLYGDSLNKMNDFFVIKKQFLQLVCQITVGLK